MATYFVFSDESGLYQEFYREKGHKYFVRAALLLDSKNWINLKNNIDNLKAEAGIPVYKEFKNLNKGSRNQFRSEKAARQFIQTRGSKPWPHPSSVFIVDDTVVLFLGPS